MNDILDTLRDIQRRLQRLERLEKPPALSVVTRFSGTPIAGRVATWSGAGTVQDAGFAGSVVTQYTGVPTAGRVTTWSGAGTVQDSGIVGTALAQYTGTPGAGTLAYWTGAGTVAAAGFGTADVARTNITQTFAALQTFSGGISLGGNETLSVYDEGTWPPAISSSGTPPTVFYTQQAGRYTRIGNVVFYSFFIRINTISGGSGDVRISLPLTAATGDANNVQGGIQLFGPDMPGTLISLGITVMPNSATLYIAGVQDNGAPQQLPVSGLANGDYLVGSGFYFV